MKTKLNTAAAAVSVEVNDKITSGQFSLGTQPGKRVSLMTTTNSSSLVPHQRRKERSDLVVRASQIARKQSTSLSNCRFPDVSKNQMSSKASDKHRDNHTRNKEGIVNRDLIEVATDEN